MASNNELATSASSSYKVVEPHPRAPTTYIHTSRGGAGNIVKADPITKGPDATGPASRHPTLRNPNRSVFTSGRGGAGNLHSNSERAIFSFDEELEAQMRQMQDLAPVCYVGRGGAGNKAFVNPVARLLETSDSESVRSDRSDLSTDSGVAVINRKFKWSWGRVVSIGAPMAG